MLNPPMENAGPHPPAWDLLASEETNEEKEKGNHVYRNT